MDAECQPAAVRAQLRHRVLLLLFVHGLQPAGQEGGAEATHNVLISDIRKIATKMD